jgi:hypothetical protein
MVYDFERNKIRQQEIEVQALVALLKKGNHHWAKKAERRLAEIAFPELLAEKINKIEDFKDDDPSVLFADKLEYQ